MNAHVILGEDGPLAARLQQAGISVEVLPIDAAARELRKDTVRLGGARGREGGREDNAMGSAALGTAAYVARLALRLRALRPDLVHTNSLKAGVYGSLAARAAGRARGVARARPHRRGLPPAPGGAFRAGPGPPSPRRRARQLRGHARHAGRRREGAAVGRPRLRGAPHAPPEPRHTRHHPPGSPAAPATTFGIVGRLAPWKGQDLFLRAFAAAFPDGDSGRWSSATPMFGEESYERELPALAARLGLAERVEFRGFREDVWAELAAFDVLVHASVIPEPFGQVVLEGMAAGLPVIAPDEGGPAETIADGETGRLFRSRDAGALAAAMRALREDPAERGRLGAAAQRAAERYHPDAVAARLEQVYERVVRQTGRRAPRSAA